MPPEKAVLRIIDANLNRLGEGLRFLEEIARFVLADQSLAAELKSTRHRFSPKNPEIKVAYVDSRDSVSDFGPKLKLKEKEPARNLVQASSANARRVQESLRVLEELAKTTSGVSLDCEELQNARFMVYTIEKVLTSRLLRQEKTALAHGFHAVIDSSVPGENPPILIAQKLLEGGARVIRFEDKNTPLPELCAVAEEISSLCRGKEALFIVHGRIEVALASMSGGLHLKENDLPVAIARKLLPSNSIIGYSAENVIEAKQAFADGADYLDFGTVFPTDVNTRHDAPGLATLSQIKNEVPLPLIASGNITTHNIGEVLRAGANSVAMMFPCCTIDSISTITREILSVMEVSHEPTES